MKKFSAKIIITLREGILDVQGKTVEKALHSIDYTTMSDVRIGKFVQLDIEAEDAGKAYEMVDAASKKLIANPIIEDYDITLEEI